MEMGVFTLVCGLMKKTLFHMFGTRLDQLEGPAVA